MNTQSDIHQPPQVALVSGATGFIGRFLILQLLQQRHQVIALMRQPVTQLPELQQWLLKRGADIQQLQAIQGDLSLPDLGVSSTDWQKVKPVNVLYNTGALFAWGLSRAQARQVNVTGALNLLTLLSQHCRLQRAVHVSGYMLTMQQHLQQAGINLAMPEQTDWDSVYKKLGAYEASKIEAHYAWIQQATTLGISWTVIHPATVAGDAIQGEIPANQPFYQLLNDLKQGRTTAIPGSPAHRIPLIGVNELVAVMSYAALDQATVNREILVADDATPYLSEVLQLAAQTMHVKAPRRYVSLKLLAVILKWRWLAGKLNLSAEMLHFLLTEQLDTHVLQGLKQQWNLPHSDIRQTIQKTANWVNLN
jgi:dihydroflavonol-4-reductase